MEDIYRCGGVYPFDAESVAVLIDLTDKDALLATFRQMAGRLFDLVDDADIELRRPVAVRAARYRMPVVSPGV
jgi:hypothetical protein